jgi:hypothetical protein
MEKIRIRDGKESDPGSPSRIRNTDINVAVPVKAVRMPPEMVRMPPAMLALVPIVLLTRHLKRQKG